jgi:hypothetical protein
MWKMAAGTALACILLAGGAVVAAEAVSPPLVLKMEAGWVDVFRPAGSFLQSLPIEGDEPDEDNRDFFTFIEDMDFDGFPDVGILFSQGQKIYYDAWLWRPDAEAFVGYEEMREIPSPRFDSESKRVTSYALVGRGSEKTILAWVNGKLAPFERTTQCLDGDSGSIVISRYLRGVDGELRLVHEETRKPTEEEACGDNAMDDARYPPELSGLNLFLGSPADMLDVAVLPNGEWWLRSADMDRTLLFESRRMPPLRHEHEKEAAERLIRTEWPQAREIAISPFPALAERLAYPALKAEFLNGENEDARRFVAALVLADEWNFWFVLEASVDAQLDCGANAEAAAGSEDLRKDMERLLLGIKAIDPADGDFLPSFGIPVYFDAIGSPLRISVMDALVRIKKVVTPENTPGIDAERIAYRFDGPGAIVGRPVLFFSFGAGNRDKFAAERRLAVDLEGMVYEMDVLAGGEYRRWEANGTLWRSEHAGGEVTPAHDGLHGNAIGVQGCYTLKSDTLDGYMTVREGDKENVHAVHIFAIQKDGANNTGEVDGGGKLVGNTIAIKYGGDDPDATIDVIFTGETAKVVTSEEFRGSGWLGAGILLDGEYTRERK